MRRAGSARACPASHGGARRPARTCLAVIALVGWSIIAADAAHAQQSGLKHSVPVHDAAACTHAPTPVTPTWAQRGQARRLVTEGHAAAIVGDDAAARDRFKKAAQLDPTSADIAYELARAYEATRNAEAASREYCRYLSLTPDSAGAADARARIAALTPPNTRGVSGEAAADSGTVAARMAAPRQRVLDPSVAFASGLVPGVGQLYTHRPALGLAVLGAVAGATYWAVHSERVTHMQSYTDPNGYTFQYPVTALERPHLTTGIAAASAITLLGAFEAYLYAKRHGGGASSAMTDGATHPAVRSLRAVPTLAPGGVGMHLTVHLPFSIR